MSEIPMNEITDFDDANEAVLEQDKALRVQPKAPSPTEYYYVNDGWQKHVCGHKHSSSVDVGVVRDAVRNGINGPRPVHVVDKDRPEKYA